MHTISNILNDLNHGIMAHNMVETCFSYRIIYFVNEDRKGEKHFIDTRYDGLRQSLEKIIRGNLTTTNTIVLAAITVRKDGESVSLLSKAYPFSLNVYFQEICESKEKDDIDSNYGRRKIQWG